VTEEQKQQYLKNDSRCPFCGSKNIDAYGDWHTDTSIAWRAVSCEDCDQTWYDQYTLTGVEEL
jgi:hypothetical protein